MSLRPLAIASVLLLALGASASCRRTISHPFDASVHHTDAHASIDAAIVPSAELGPPNPWGDGALPDTTARGPEVSATLTTMSALRASIGFWRVTRDQRDRCPTMDDLAATPAAAFDRATMSHDAWGATIRIECQGSRVHLRSSGPDGTMDTPDDVLAE